MSLEIYVLDPTDKYRWSKELVSLQFSNGIPGGSLTLTAELPRKINATYDDTALLNEVIIRDGIDIIWQGFMSHIPKESGDRKLITVNALGYYAYGSHFAYNTNYDFVTGTYDKADEIIQKTITDMGANRKISNDYTDFTAGAYTVIACTANFRFAREIWDEVNKYELYDIGCWGSQLASGADTSDTKPAFFYLAHSKTTVDYFTTLKEAKLSLAGPAVDDLADRVIVEYGSASHVERTTTSSYLTGRNWAKHGPKITIQSTNVADANQAGDKYLTEANLTKAKGTMEITGSVRDAYNKEVKYYEIRAGKNIRIKDLEATEDMFSASNVLDGRTTFKIVKVDVDVGRRSAKLTLDQPADELDVILARLMDKTKALV